MIALPECVESPAVLQQQIWAAHFEFPGCAGHSLVRGLDIQTNMRIIPGDLRDGPVQYDRLEGVVLSRHRMMRQERRGREQAKHPR